MTLREEYRKELEEIEKKYKLKFRKLKFNFVVELFLIIFFLGLIIVYFFNY